MNGLFPSGGVSPWGRGGEGARAGRAPGGHAGGRGPKNAVEASASRVTKMKKIQRCPVVAQQLTRESPAQDARGARRKRETPIQRRA